MGAQFAAYPSVRSSILRWRNETQAPIPVHISKLAETMSQRIWIEANSYDITQADNDSGTIQKSVYHLQAWAVNVEKKREARKRTIIFFIFLCIVPYDKKKYLSRYQKLLWSLLMGMDVSG